MSRLWKFADEGRSNSALRDVDGFRDSVVPIHITGVDDDVFGTDKMKDDIVSLIVEKLAQHERRTQEFLHLHARLLTEAVQSELTKSAGFGSNGRRSASSHHTSEPPPGRRKSQDSFIVRVQPTTDESDGGSDAEVVPQDNGCPASRPAFGASSSSGSSCATASHESGDFRANIGPCRPPKLWVTQPGTPAGGVPREKLLVGSSHVVCDKTVSEQPRWTVRSMESQHEEFQEEFHAHVQIQEAAVLSESFHPLAGKLIQHPAFEYCVCGLVLLNAICIGVRADWVMKSLRTSEREEPVLFQVADKGFALVFAAELLLRIAGEGRNFLRRKSRNYLWNALDTILVLFGLLEEILQRFLISAPNMTIMRLLRMLRMVRAVRVFRTTQFFTDMRLLVMGLMCAARSLFGVVVLLFFVMYIFSVGLMELTAESIIWNPGTSGLAEDEAIFEYVGSLEVTLFTLFKSVSGGLDWGDAVKQLAKRGPVLSILFSTYIMFTTLCILNIATGIFVQNASTIAQHDQMELGLEHVERRQIWLQEVLDVFKLADAEGRGRIDWPNFKNCITKPSVQACFTKLGIDLESVNARGLFCLFDFDGDGTIDFEEFARGVLKMHGQARSLDLHLVFEDTKRILNYVQMMRKGK